MFFTFITQIINNTWCTYIIFCTLLLFTIQNSHSIFSLNENTHLLASSANEVKLCNQNSKNLVTQCTQRIKISQENIQNLLIHMRENVEASGKNEEISKILLQVADELKIVCHNLESELSQFQI